MLHTVIATQDGVRVYDSVIGLSERGANIIAAQVRACMPRALVEIVDLVIPAEPPTRPLGAAARKVKGR